MADINGKKWLPGQILMAVLCILSFSLPLISSENLLKHNNVFKRVLRSSDGIATVNVDSIVKRQIFPGPFYAPSAAGCGPGGCPACSPNCGCPPGAVYSPVACAPPIPAAFPSLAGPPIGAPIPPPLPPPAGRLIPQALPGAPCEPGVECTGGSVCSMGICLCPPELVQEGTVCVSRTVYGVAPPPPIAPGLPPPSLLAPPPPPPPAFAAFQPPPLPAYPLPIPGYPSPVLATPPALLGGPGGCMPGTFCDAGFCRCAPAFGPGFGGTYVRKTFEDNYYVKN